MRVLVVTQRIDENDDLLAFFVEWVRRLATRVDAVHVVAQEVRSHDLSGAVRVHSLGKERGVGRWARLARLQRALFDQLVVQRSADVILCHMCPEYLVAACAVARASRTPSFLWYTHGANSAWLRLAYLVSDGILTAGLPGFPLRGRKIVAMGHGIDLEKFRPRQSRSESGPRILLSVGRLSPIKAHEVAIRALSILVHEKRLTDIELRIIGGTPLPSQQGYFESLRRLVAGEKLEGHVRFLGSIPYRQIQDHLGSCDVFISASRTGSLDKAPLEAMACGKVVVASSSSFRSELEPFEDRLTFRQDDHSDLAGKLFALLAVDRQHLAAIGDRLRQNVGDRHALDRLVERMVRVFDDAL